MTAMADHPPHAHQHAPATAIRHERRTWGVAGLTVAATAAELAGGWWTGSAAVAAEGLHMGAHVSAFVLAGAAYALARGLKRAGRPGVAERVPDIGALLNGLLLIGLGAALAAGSFLSLRSPAAPAYGTALGIAVFGLLVNLIAAAMLHHPHAHEAGHGRDLNFRAIYLHVLGDAGVAVLAIVGLLLGRSFGWRWTDPAAGALGAVLVIVLGLQVTTRSARLLLGGRFAGEAGAAPRRPRVAPEPPIR